VNYSTGEPPDPVSTKNSITSFKSNTDTEVVLKCYEEYGLDALSKFNGLFGFAIWDAVKKELLLARDRIGVKPLYYYWNQGRLVFGSEIKSILEAPIPKEVNRQALYHYMG
jgi:asparagine synthase (glutamine-hydrolysing)